MAKNQEHVQADPVTQISLRIKGPLKNISARVHFQNFKVFLLKSVISKHRTQSN